MGWLRRARKKAEEEAARAHAAVQQLDTDDEDSALAHHHASHPRTCLPCMLRTCITIKRDSRVHAARGLTLVSSNEPRYASLPAQHTSPRRKTDCAVRCVCTAQATRSTTTTSRTASTRSPTSSQRGRSRCAGRARTTSSTAVLAHSCAQSRGGGGLVARVRDDGAARRAAGRTHGIVAEAVHAGDVAYMVVCARIESAGTRGTG